jgi:hypothetical protein
MDNTTGSRVTRKFLNEAEKAGRVISVSDELPKSFIVCGEKRPSDRLHSTVRGGSFEVYLSQLSSQTLQKRSEVIKGIVISMKE